MKGRVEFSSRYSCWRGPLSAGSSRPPSLGSDRALDDTDPEEIVGDARSIPLDRPISGRTRTPTSSKRNRLLSYATFAAGEGLLDTPTPQTAIADSGSEVRPVPPGFEVPAWHKVF